MSDSLELLFSSEPDRQQAVTRVYLALAQNPGSTRQWRVDRGEHPRAVEYALDTLQMRGLVHVHFNIHLHSTDTFSCACYFKVHITKVVFIT